MTNRFPLFPFLPQSAVVILVWHKTYIDCQNPSTYFNPFLCKCTSSKWIQPEFISNLISVITMHTLRIYCQLYTFLHLFFSHVDKQYYLCFNICLFQSTSVSTVQTAVYPGSDNSMCQLTLINRGHIFWDFHHCVPIYDFEDWLFEWLKICTGHTCWIFIHYLSSYAFPDSLF